jgi:alkylation response protein AidB-like acyl-CoA dehydrogenase
MYEQFANQVVAPKAELLETHGTCLREFIQELGQKGHLGIAVPREYGGQGGSFLDVILFVEAVCRYDAGLALTLGSHLSVIEVLKMHGTPNQKSRYLPLLSRGELTATLSFSEAQAGTDWQAVESQVKGEGQGLKLSGKKTNIISGEIANLYLVLAKVAGELSLQLVDSQENAGIKCGDNKQLMGLRSAYINDLEFKDVGLSAEGSINSKGSAADIAFDAMDCAALVLAAGALAIAERGTDEAVNHAKQRQQFGVSIGQFQGVQWKLADMKVETTGARLQLYRAAWSRAEDFSQFKTNTAMCKWFAARTARLHTGEALQILGASGLVTGGFVEQAYRDAKTMEIVQGTAEFHKMTLVKQLEI